jgi:hypothetical protein
LKVNGVAEESQEVSLAGGETTSISFTVAKSESKTYEVEIGDLTGNFSVVRPASFIVSDLTIGATQANVDEQVPISIKITNVGDVKGPYTATLKMNDSIAETKTVTLAGGESTSVVFDISTRTPGAYEIDIDGQKQQFSVEPPPSSFTYWLYVGVIAVGAAAIGLTMLFIGRKRMMLLTKTWGALISIWTRTFSN